MAYDFNPTNSYLQSGAPVTGEPITMAAWFYPQSSGTIRSILSLGDTASDDRRSLLLGTANAIGAVDNGTANVTVTTPITAPQNQWSHTCCIFQSATSRTCYANGGSATTNTTNRGTQVTANSFVIAARYLTGIGAYMVGRIAEVGLWNVALTADEIASLADGMTCDKVRPQSLVFYAPLVRDLQDVRGGLTITNNNGATVANHPRVYA
jgi:hypothetical protein